MKIDKDALKESIIDTSIGLPINWLFAYLTLLLLYLFDITDILIISIAQVTVLTILAIIRKYCVRVYFGGKNESTKLRN
tara:strand:+ start:1970 stop:2206 length:237 start_codon:yes stop_codon:yes gene_type:complete